MRKIKRHQTPTAPPKLPVLNNGSTRFASPISDRSRLIPDLEKTPATLLAPTIEEEAAVAVKTVDSPTRNAAGARGIYAISRLKAARNAWYWAVHFKRRGKLYFKRFYELKHGGSEQALAAAKAWRDRKLAMTKTLTHREFHAQRRSNNLSGVAGVHFVKSERQPSGAWQAKIKLPDGRKITKSFSVLKFGRREAFKRASAARADMLTLIDQQPYLYDETAKRFAAKQRRGV